MKNQNFLFWGIILLFSLNLFGASRTAVINTGYIQTPTISVCNNITCSGHGVCKTQKINNVYRGVCQCHTGYRRSGYTKCIPNFKTVWDFNGTSNNYRDKSGNGHHLEAVGISYTNNGIERKNSFNRTTSKSAKFNGSSYFEAGRLTTTPQNFTITMWINPTDISKTMAFVAKNGSRGTNELVFGHYGKRIHLNINDKGYSFSKLSKGWQHYAIVVKRIYSSTHKKYVSKWQVYRNSFLLKEVTLDREMDYSAGKPWTIGMEWDSSRKSDFFHGEMDNINFHEYAMSKAQVRNNLNLKNPCVGRSCSSGLCILKGNMSHCMCDTKCSGKGTCSNHVKLETSNTDKKGYFTNLAGVVVSDSEFMTDNNGNSYVKNGEICKCQAGYTNQPLTCVANCSYMNSTCSGTQEGFQSCEIDRNTNSAVCNCDEDHINIANNCYFKNFEDENLNKCIQEKLGKSVYTKKDLLKIYKLDCSNRGIKSLKGVGLLQKLNDADFSGNKIEDLSPLRNMSGDGFAFMPNEIVVCGSKMRVEKVALSASDAKLYCPKVNAGIRVKFFNAKKENGASLRDKILCHNKLDIPHVLIEKAPGKCENLAEDGFVVKTGIFNNNANSPHFKTTPNWELWQPPVYNSKLKKWLPNHFDIPVCTWDSNGEFPHVVIEEIEDKGRENDVNIAKLKCGEGQRAQKVTVLIPEFEWIADNSHLKPQIPADTHLDGVFGKEAWEEKLDPMGPVTNSKYDAVTVVYPDHTFGYSQFGQITDQVSANAISANAISARSLSTSKSLISKSNLNGAVPNLVNLPFRAITNRAGTALNSTAGTNVVAGTKYVGPGGVIFGNGHYKSNLREHSSFYICSTKATGASAYVEIMPVFTKNKESFCRPKSTSKKDMAYVFPDAATYAYRVRIGRKMVPVMKTFDLSDNKISNIQPLHDFYKLKNLYLTGNNLHDNDLVYIKGQERYSDVLNPLRYIDNMTILDINSNQIKSLRGLEKMKDLFNLYASNNGILDLKPLTFLKELRILDISKNRDKPKISAPVNRAYSSATDVVNSTSGTTVIFEQYLAGSMIELDFEGPLGELNNLEALDISYNKIEDISMLRGGISNINETQEEKETLKSDTSFVYGDDFDKLDPVLHKSLKYLYANNNKITDLSGLESLPEIKELDISSNPVFDLDPIKDVWTLEALFAENNMVYDFSPLQYLVNLQYLDISDSKLTTPLSGQIRNLDNLDFISGLDLMKGVDVSGTGLNGIEALAYLTYLEYINLENNFLESVDPILSHDKVEEINITNNCIESFPSFNNSWIVQGKSLTEQTNCGKEEEKIAGYGYNGRVKVTFNKNFDDVSSSRINDKMLLENSAVEKVLVRDDCLTDGCAYFHDNMSGKLEIKTSLDFKFFNSMSFVMFVKPENEFSALRLLEMGKTFGIYLYNNRIYYAGRGNLDKILENVSETETPLESLKRIWSPTSLELKTNQWNAVIFTYSDSRNRVKIYLNDTDNVWSKTESYQFYYGNRYMQKGQINRLGLDDAHAFVGKIDDFMFYSSELFTGQIDSILNDVIEQVNKEIDQKDDDKIINTPMEKYEENKNYNNEFTVNDTKEERNNTWVKNAELEKEPNVIEDCPANQTKVSYSGKQFCDCGKGYHFEKGICIIDDNRQGRIRPLTEDELARCPYPSVANCYDNDYLASECGGLHVYRTCRQYSQEKFWKKTDIVLDKSQIMSDTIDSDGTCHFNDLSEYSEKCETNSDCPSYHYCDNDVCKLHEMAAIESEPLTCVPIMEYVDLEDQPDYCYKDNLPDTCNLAKCKYVEAEEKTFVTKCLPNESEDVLGDLLNSDEDLDNYCYDQYGRCDTSRCDEYVICFAKLPGDDDARFKAMKEIFDPRVGEIEYDEEGKASKVSSHVPEPFDPTNMPVNDFIEFKNRQTMYIKNMINSRRYGIGYEVLIPAFNDNMDITPTVIPYEDNYIPYVVHNASYASGLKTAMGIMTSPYARNTYSSIAYAASSPFYMDSNRTRFAKYANKNRLVTADLILNEDAQFAQIKTNLPPSSIVPESRNIVECKEYVHRKYYDYNRYLELASLFNDDPMVLIKLTLDGTSEKDYNVPYGFNIFANQMGAFEAGNVALYNSASQKRGGHVHNHYTGQENEDGDILSYVHKPEYAFHPMMGISMRCDFDDNKANNTNCLKIEKEKNIFHKVMGQLLRKSYRKNPRTQAYIPSSENGLFIGYLKNLDYGIDIRKEIRDVYYNVRNERNKKITVDLLDYKNVVEGNINEVKKKYEYLRFLRRRLLTLLLNRANIEKLWNQKRTIAFELNPDDANTFYDVATVKSDTLNILKGLSIYSDVSHMNHMDDIKDQDLLMLLNQENEDGEKTISLETALRLARRDEKLRLQAKLHQDIIENKFTETENAKTLWGRYHYGKEKYNLDAREDDPFYTKIKDPKDVYPQGDTELLINTVLYEIDKKIEKVFNEAFDFGCFETGNTVGLCDINPDDFIRHMRGFVPESAMEGDHRTCENFTRNDVVGFDNLNKFPMFKIYVPKGDAANYYTIAGQHFELQALRKIGDTYRTFIGKYDNSDISESWKPTVRMLRESEVLLKIDTKMKDSTIANDVTQDDLDKYIGKLEYMITKANHLSEDYKAKSGDQDKLSDTFNFGGDYDEVETHKNYHFDSKKVMKGYNSINSNQFKQACGINSFNSNSKINFSKNWECLEQFYKLYPLWKQEQVTIDNNVRLVRSKLSKLARALKRAKALKAGKVMAKSIDTQKNPTNSDSNYMPTLEKWYSDYKGNTSNKYIGLDLSYLVGLGLRDYDIFVDAASGKLLDGIINKAEVVIQDSINEYIAQGFSCKNKIQGLANSKIEELRSAFTEPLFVQPFRDLANDLKDKKIPNINLDTIETVFETIQEVVALIQDLKAIRENTDGLFSNIVDNVAEETSAKAETLRTALTGLKDWADRAGLPDSCKFQPDLLVVDDLYKVFLDSMKELLTSAPYFQAVAHAQSTFVLFKNDIELFDITWYYSTRGQKAYDSNDDFGFKGADQQAVDRMVGRHGKKIIDNSSSGQFNTETYFYMNYLGKGWSYDDMAANMKKLAEKGVKKLEEKINDMAENLDEKAFGSITNDKPGDNTKDYPLGQTGMEKSINFQIGPVPCVLAFGFNLEFGVRIGAEYNMTIMNGKQLAGFTGGAMVGPYIVAGAFLEVGVGFDYGIISFSIGIRGDVTIFDFTLPLKISAMVAAEMENDELAVNFYLRTSLIPRLKILYGKLSLFCKGRIGKSPFAIGFSKKKTFFKFDPLLDYTFPNLIPVKPLKVDLMFVSDAFRTLNGAN